LIGILAVQGDFSAHSRMLELAGAAAVEVRRPGELSDLAGLVIPGGESTTMLKFLLEEGLAQSIKEFAASARPILGTCAGAILLSREVLSPSQPSLSLIDIVVERNAYGRQADSFVGHAETSLDGGPMEAVFIRAPRIRRLGPRVEPLALLDREPVLVRESNVLAATFHPELTSDTRVHNLLVEMALACGDSSPLSYRGDLSPRSG
jgi:5'-phosphate synthase pdxT subunit